MTRIGSFKRFDNTPSLQWMLRRLQAMALALMLLGLLIDVSLARAPTPDPSSGAHVYLLRGAFNIFSLGMDQLAEKLERLGISTTVTNYLDWPTLAEQAAAGYKSGRLRTIILIGHSSGAVAITEMAARLSQLNVPVKLAIGLDPTSRMTATGNVDLYINYYVAHGMGTPVDRGAQFSGTLQNVDMENDPNIGHFNIDKNPALQDRVITDIRASLFSPSLHCVGGKVCLRSAEIEGLEPSPRVNKRTKSKTRYTFPQSSQL